MANPTPAITFRANLAFSPADKIGPLTNERDLIMFSPDQFQPSFDRGREETSARTSTISSFLPTFTLGNRVLKHGDEFVEYGMKAVYLRDTYGIGYAPTDRAVLTVVSVD